MRLLLAGHLSCGVVPGLAGRVINGHGRGCFSVGYSVCKLREAAVMLLVFVSACVNKVTVLFTECMADAQLSGQALKQ